MNTSVSVLYFFLIGSLGIALYAIIGINRAMRATNRLPAASQVVSKDANLYSYATGGMLLLWVIGTSLYPEAGHMPTIGHIAAAAMLTFLYAVVALALRGHAITFARIAAG